LPVSAPRGALKIPGNHLINGQQKEAFSRLQNLRFTPVHAIKGQSLLREGDLVFRFAGDEFVALLPNQDLASATRVERSGPAVTCG
jgi:hypothetical protein